MYQIIIDTCGETLPNENFKAAPLDIIIDGETIADNGHISQEELLAKIDKSKGAPGSACPSPETYLNLIESSNADRIYIVAVSSGVSGSYNSAELASRLYHEKHNSANTQISVIDSRSASIGQTLIALKIKELEKAGKDFLTIGKKVREYLKELNTYFVLDNLETARKNGRLSGIQFMAANMLNIKPIMKATEEGITEQLSQARGMKKALKQMVDHMLSQTKNHADKILGIAHCACPETAGFVKSLIEEKSRFREIIITETSGLSTVYANKGGIILAV